MLEVANISNQFEAYYLRSQVSVMCTTVEKRRIHGDMEECKYGSCAEWCLSKGGGDCTQLIVR